MVSRRDTFKMSDGPWVPWVIWRMKGGERQVRVGFLDAPTAEDAVRCYRWMLPMAERWTLEAVRRGKR